MVMDTVSEVKNLKKQARKLKRTSGNGDPQPESELTQKRMCRDVFNSVNLLMWRLFTEEEIIFHSVSRKAANSKTLAKPKFNNTKLELLKSHVIERHKEVTCSQISCKNKNPGHPKVSKKRQVTNIANSIYYMNSRIPRFIFSIQRN